MLVRRLVLLASVLLLACAPRSDGSLAGLGEALRARFPGQAARVLAAPRAFAAAGEGFSAEPRGGVSAELPRRGEGALRFALGPGLDVRVREVDAGGEAVSAERAVAYGRAGGSSFWAAEEDGYEEWLLLDAAAVRRDRPVAAWEIEGATVRQRGEAVEVVDGRGEAWLSVTAPEAYAAGGRPVGARLAAHGERIELWADAEGEAVLVDPAWRRTRPMPEGRSGHTATRLSNGGVLVVGGSDGVTGSCAAAVDPITLVDTGCALATAELYDPVTSTWTHAAPMSTPRTGHTATLLADGTVLVVGGIVNDQSVVALASAELYDPPSDSWKPAPSLSGPRAYHTATQLGDGRILVAGGIPSGNVGGVLALSSAEVYDPHAVPSGWTDAGTMKVARRAGHTATLLADGAVLVAGGFPNVGGAISNAEIYSPGVAAVNAWKAVAHMNAVRAAHTATRLLDGSVLVTGGNPQGKASAERYDPKGQWSIPGQMIVGRAAHTATLLTDGRVLVAGGATADGGVSAEAFDPALGGFLALPRMNAAHQGHTATLLDDDRVLVAGGIGEPNVTSAELFEARAHQWTLVAPMIPDASLSPTADRMVHTATLLTDGRVLVAGGQDRPDQPDKSEVFRASAEAYDPDADRWSLVGPMSSARAGHTATRLGDGRVLVVGGADAYGSISDIVRSAELFDPESATWTPAGPLNFARESHVATLLDDGRVLVTGGYDGNVFLDGAEIYDPVADAWSETANHMSIGRYAHGATVLDDGRVLVTGGNTAGGATAGAEVYNPGTDTWATVAAMGTARSYHSTTRLDGGLVLVAGGYDQTSDELATVEVFDPAANRWTGVSKMNSAHVRHNAFTLPLGLVLVAGGESPSAETYDPTENMWTPVAWMNTAHNSSAMAPLGGGRVLVTGGTPYPTDTGLSTAEVFPPRQPAGAVCAASFECASGACLGGVCCDSACDTDCNACSVADGATADGHCTLIVPCHDFACMPRRTPLACFTTCTTSRDCAPGRVCDTSHACVVPQNTYLDDTCALSPLDGPVRGPRTFEPAAFFLAALAALRRRARAPRAV